MTGDLEFPHLSSLPYYTQYMSWSSLPFVLNLLFTRYVTWSSLPFHPLEHNTSYQSIVFLSLEKQFAEFKLALLW